MRVIKKQKKNINAMDAACNLLKFRSRSKKELSDRLALKGISETDIKDVIDRLSSMGYIDDLKFAKELACSKKKQGKGVSFIKNELRKKGVDSQYIDETIVSLYENKEEEIEHLKQIALKKIKTLMKLPPKIIYGKLTEYLARRGFKYNKIAEALKSLKIQGELDETIQDE